MRRGVVDRFEGEYVLIELDGKIEEFPVSFLYGDVREGDAVVIDGKTVRTDKESTKELKKKIQNLMNDVWKD